MSEVSEALIGSNFTTLGGLEAEATVDSRYLELMPIDIEIEVDVMKRRERLGSIRAAVDKR